PNLTFTVGGGWEPESWYYAQTNPGVWTVSFPLDRAYTGTAYLTVSTAMQQGGRPTVAVNGNTADITGSLPSNNDSTIARQADRSGFPRLSTLSFPASLLVAGANTVTFTHGSASAAGSGPGWDTLVLEVDEGAPPAAAQLAGSAVLVANDASSATWRLTVTNTGTGAANDVRLNAVVWRDPRRAGSDPALAVAGRDPNKFPVPVAAAIPPGGSATAEVTVDAAQGGAASDVLIQFSANGGRARGIAAAMRQP
ncbi:MAG TPA: polysaccharide lyase family protein, partial [Kribbellaceae bacterium]